jgi:hypothetical protein
VPSLKGLVNLSRLTQGFRPGLILFRPYGTRSHLPPTQPAAAGWAKLFRPFGADFCALLSPVANPYEVATQSLKAAGIYVVPEGTRGPITRLPSAEALG